MCLHISSTSHAALASIENNYANHITVVNDIYSYAKELQASLTQSKHAEGRAMCSSVTVLGREASLSVQSTMKVLWTCVREWEFEHVRLVEQRLAMNRDQATPESRGDEMDVRRYLEALQWQMSGNEEWSRTTKRYVCIKEDRELWCSDARSDPSSNSATKPDSEPMMGIVGSSPSTGRDSAISMGASFLPSTICMTV